MLRTRDKELMVSDDKLKSSNDKVRERDKRIDSLEKNLIKDNENLLIITEVAKAKIEAFNAAYKIDEDQELTEEERARRECMDKDLGFGYLRCLDRGFG